MRGGQKITRIRLSVNEENFPIAFGLVTPDPDYKISLKLNNKLSLSLKNADPVEIRDNKDNILIFSRFCDDIKAPDVVVQLISNRSKKNFLLNKLKNIDYLLLLDDPMRNFDLSRIISQIREIDSITGVFNVEIKTLKDKNINYLI
jgi:hypothetical protein